MLHTPIYPEIVMADKWHQVLYYRALHIMRHNYFPTTKMMEAENYRALMMEYAAAVNDYSPTCLLSDMRQFLYVIPISEQIWMREYTRSLISRNKVRKMAVIQGTDFLSQLSLEQSLPDTQWIVENVAYFQGEKEALYWLTDPGK